jgi:CRP/FNR family transcriptional regulator
LEVSRAEQPQSGRAAAPWHAELLRHYPVLKELPAKLAENLRARAGLVTLPAGTTAFDEGSSCSGLVLITRGSVRVVRAGPQGREIMLYRVRPGESCILSVSCLLGRTSFAARGVVEADLTGVSIPGELFETLVSENAAFRTFIFDLFGSRVSTLLQLVEEVAFYRLDQRLAALLLRRFEQTGGRMVETTHQEMADQIGSIREIVSRILESFENAGIIALSRGRVTLLDSDLLRTTAFPPLA